jgi:hypothetical protein
MESTTKKTETNPEADRAWLAVQIYTFPVFWPYYLVDFVRTIYRKLRRV